MCGHVGLGHDPDRLPAFDHEDGGVVVESGVDLLQGRGGFDRHHRLAHHLGHRKRPNVFALLCVTDVAVRDDPDGAAVADDRQLREALVEHHVAGGTHRVVGRDAHHGPVHQIGRTDDAPFGFLQRVHDPAERREPRVHVTTLDAGDERL